MTSVDYFIIGYLLLTVVSVAVYAAIETHKETP